jgi:hippurate hydrolase
MTTTTPASNTFVSEAKDFGPTMVALRRAIHADPEIGQNIPRTQKRVLDALDGLPLEIIKGKDISSITAILRGDKPGPTVLLRGDMDALPGTEENDLPFKSTNGAMHTCGHDLHTSSLVGAAHILSAHKKDLPGTVIFMFQPGEEGPGGAKPMLDEGLLTAAGTKPVAAYAIHVCPGPIGQMFSKTGTLLAGSNNLNVTITGKGGHGSSPQLAIDPVPVAAEVILALQSFVTRTFSVFDPVVLSVTQVSTGDDAINEIPETVTLGATIRTLSDKTGETLAQNLPPLINDIAAAHGATAKVDYAPLYPPTINAVDEDNEAVAALRAEFGDDKVTIMANPIMGSEDFSFVLDQVPGAMFALACTPPGMDPKKVEFNHSPKAVFDDAVLPTEAAALVTMAWDRLNKA